jgi:hypothetical protein
MVASCGGVDQEQPVRQICSSPTDGLIEAGQIQSALRVRRR